MARTIGHSGELTPTELAPITEDLTLAFEMAGIPSAVPQLGSDATVTLSADEIISLAMALSFLGYCEGTRTLASDIAEDR